RSEGQSMCPDGMPFVQKKDSALARKCACDRVHVIVSFGRFNHWAQRTWKMPSKSGWEPLERMRRAGACLSATSLPGPMRGPAYSIDRLRWKCSGLARDRHRPLSSTEAVYAETEKALRPTLLLRAGAVPV